MNGKKEDINFDVIANKDGGTLVFILGFIVTKVQLHCSL